MMDLTMQRSLENDSDDEDMDEDDKVDEDYIDISYQNRDLNIV